MNFSVVRNLLFEVFITKNKNMKTTVIIVIACLLILWKWDWIKERIQDLLALCGRLLCLAICGALVYLGAWGLHEFTGLNYIAGGAIVLTIIILYGREH